ncbi:hypothetical protein C3K47_19105 [Solitalea longa]|uniref:Uncharacterized protein n=1 Tax=Solitalea longa TaxID=2079460 RepID=A0A2S4ZWB5_9SPHI|nr:DUF6252 family protein [Solitalea longa]POY34658.1 hypothetical protein C3K47_19105 [Solitalea longa]
MKNKYVELKWFFIALILSLCACSPDDDAHEKEFRCKVNGQKWSPFSDDFKFNPVDGQSQITTSGKRALLLVGYNSKNETQNVGFLISDLVNEKDYPLSQEPNSYGLVEINETVYRTDDINKGIVSIHSLDTVNHKVSGTFTFKAKSLTSNSTVNVSEGYFDITYKVY